MNKATMEAIKIRPDCKPSPLNIPSYLKPYVPANVTVTVSKTILFRPNQVVSADSRLITWIKKTVPQWLI